MQAEILRIHVLFSVFSVAHDGVAEFRHMHADLVFFAGQQIDPHQ